MSKQYNLDTLREIDDLRSIWKNEAHDFTPWLAQEENIKLLSDAIGVDIIVTEVESPVGPFSVDIVGKEIGGDRIVVIENQLESTDHDHLGKAITYAAGKNADIIIWCVKEAREEHRAAVEWANRKFNSEVAFFLCEIKLYQIGDSLPAVKFDVIEKPNEWLKANNKTSENLGQIRFEYWSTFCNYIQDNPRFISEFKWNGVVPSDYYFNLRIGKSICHLALIDNRRGGEISVEIYIPNNKDFYRKLYLNKDTIESELNCELCWMELPSKSASRILVKMDADTNNRSKWSEYFEWYVQQSLQLKSIIIKNL